MIVASLIFMVLGFVFLMLGRGSDPNVYQFLSIAASLIAGTLLIMGFLKERKRRPASATADVAGDKQPGGTAAAGPVDVEADLKALEQKGLDDEDLQPAGQGAAATIVQEPVSSNDAPMVSANRQWSTLISDVDKEKFEPPAYEKSGAKTEKEDAHTQGGPGKGNINMEQPVASASKPQRGFLGRFKRKAKEPVGSSTPSGVQPSGVPSPASTSEMPKTQVEAGSDAEKGPEEPGSEGRPESGPIGEHLESVVGNVSAASPSKPKSSTKTKTTAKPRVPAKPRAKPSAKPKPASKPKAAAKPKAMPQKTPKVKVPAKPKTSGKSSGAPKPQSTPKPRTPAKAKATGPKGKARPTAKPKTR